MNRVPKADSARLLSALSEKWWKSAQKSAQADILVAFGTPLNSLNITFGDHSPKMA
jgi:hypothetical protein